MKITTIPSISKVIVQSLILFILASISAFSSSASVDPKPAADFTLKSDSGKNIRLSEQRGHVVMLNFWAHWCGPCRQEMPHLEKLYQRYGKAGFKLLAINVDKNTEDANRFLKDIETSFPILYDPKGTTSETYNVSAMPTTILIDRNGKTRFVHRGYKPGYEEKYKKEIRSLLRE